MRSGTLINMYRLVIFLAVFALSFAAKAELIMVDEIGDLALSSDSIEIKSKDGRKVVQGVVYGFSNGVKKSMVQFVTTCGELGGSLQIQGYAHESIWVVGGNTREDMIARVACSLPKPELVEIPK